MMDHVMEGASARNEYFLCPAKQRFVSLFVTELKKVASLSQCISIGNRAVYRRFQSAFQNIRYTGYIRDWEARKPLLSLKSMIWIFQGRRTKGRTFLSVDKCVYTRVIYYFLGKVYDKVTITVWYGFGPRGKETPLKTLLSTNPPSPLPASPRLKVRTFSEHRKNSLNLLHFFLPWRSGFLRARKYACLNHSQQVIVGLVFLWFAGN